MSRRRRRSASPGSPEPGPQQATKKASTTAPNLAARRWKRVVVASAVAALLGAALWTARYSLPGPLGATTLPSPQEPEPAPSATSADFVGAGRCASCHASEYARWRTSTHGRAGGSASPDVVIAPFDGRPIRFRDATVTPRVRGSRYEFVVAPDGEPAQVVAVDGVIGGGHMVGGGTQGFVTNRPDGTVRFVPFDWSRHGATWFCNTNSRAERGWVPISTAMRLSDCGDWPPVRVLGDVSRWTNCQGCHGSQLTVTGDGASRTTRFTSLAINCESCHGPGRRHVALAESGRIAESADIGLASLGTLDKDAALAVCYQCHAVKDRLAAGFVSGEPLAQYYSLRTPALGDRPLHADGRVRTFAYQEAHAFSDCYLSGGMTCGSCHDPHGQTYRSANGQPLVGRFDDRQCTSCHASKVSSVGEHTHHAPGSAGSRCTACHMPYLQSPETTDRSAGRAGVRYARSDHSIAIPRPRPDSSLGVVTACAGCHATRTTAELDAQIRSWWGVGKPRHPQVSAQLAVGATPDGLLSAAATPGSIRHVAATFGALARYYEAIPAADGVTLTESAREQLAALARDADVDVRALALAALHLAAGSEPSIRRILARAAAREGPRDFALRSRWSVALGFAGDRFSESGDFASARTAYSRALEVAPANPRLILSRANAERASGDLRAAIASYEGALALEPASALVMVNLAIALGDSGDGARAADWLRRATAADPGEPLAWFNLGNLALQAGDLSGAARHFSRAIEVDGSLAEAHFQLARVHLLEGNAQDALPALRRGLALDPSNDAAREVVAQIEKSRPDA